MSDHTNEDKEKVVTDTTNIDETDPSGEEVSSDAGEGVSETNGAYSEVGAEATEDTVAEEPAVDDADSQDGTDVSDADSVDDTAAEESSDVESAEESEAEQTEADPVAVEEEVPGEVVADHTKKGAFHVGDMVRVHYRIVEGTKTRVQPFQGLVIAEKGEGTGRTFMVRHIAKGGVGVERIFPIFSPNIQKIEVLRHGKVRRAKLYYLRERIGKRALKVKERSA